MQFRKRVSNVRDAPIIDEHQSRWTDTDRQLMRRALNLARRGVGQVSPSPLVGCVIADSHGEIFGEGAYLYDGIKHAETLALQEAGPRARGATAYVTLEPHAHHSRTPPCTDALIAAGVARVVASITDPNPKVSGRGFADLETAGIQIDTGLFASEAEHLNEKYIHYMRTGRPFVHLKLACSIDGRIATRTRDSIWITGEKSRARVHEMRHEYDAILVGAGTVLADDPILTDRSGRPRRRPLVRVILDEKLRLRPESKLASTTNDAPVVVFASELLSETRASSLTDQGVEILYEANGGRDLIAVLQLLGNRSIQSLLVEGGATVAGAFLDAGLVNKVSFFLAPIVIGGRDAPAAVGGLGAEKIADAIRLRETVVLRHDDDMEITGYIGSHDAL